MTKAEDRNRDWYNYDYDGRPPVGKDNDDPLLKRLHKFHIVIDAPRPQSNPGVPDEPGSSD